MEFEDEEVNLLNSERLDVVHLIIRYLCGESHLPRLSQEDKNLLEKLMNNAKQEGLNYRQFNELLLLLNQDRVGEDFFKFFFKKDKVFPDDLKKGITKFRGFAMLCFGNFRFAYKQLIQMNEDEIKKKLSPYWKTSQELEEEFRKRPSKMLEIEKIEKDKTWYLGEISGEKVKKEAEQLENEIKKAKSNRSQFDIKELREFEKELSLMKKYVEEVEKKALRNADVYLTWDYMDIYIATSMRNKWEFEETFDFISKVFSDEHLKKLNLRIFDPTQSKCKNPKDKGLMEGLMLKRALCTIYLAQESDTMGKDSELAATLAQSKPVIAYVPKYNHYEEYAQKIREYPLDFFKKRLHILDAEEVFEDPVCREKLKNYNPSFGEIISEFYDKLDEYRSNQPFSLWTEKEEEFKRNYLDFQMICDILAIAECYNFDKRAELLKRHPLSMQVDLQSGVANGVLVVRSPEDCAELLYRILTNQTEFEIKHETEGYTVLLEKVSQSPFRIVTDHERLTNSFWNLFI